MKWITKAVVAMLVLAPSARADEARKTKPTTRADKTKAEKPQPRFITTDAMTWMDAPPDLPKGAQITVLRGDPFKPGPYTIRFKVPDGYKVPAHHHSRDEEFTLISGRFAFYMGDMTKPDTHELTAGDYHFLPAKSTHWVEAKSDTVFQLSGTGPFDIIYLRAEDNPNPKTAKR